MKWRTIVKLVDLETGEELRKEHIEKKIYSKIYFTTQYQQNGNNYDKINTWRCRKNPTIQTEIWG